MRWAPLRFWAARARWTRPAVSGPQRLQSNLVVAGSCCDKARYQQGVMSSASAGRSGDKARTVHVTLMHCWQQQRESTGRSVVQGPLGTACTLHQFQTGDALALKRVLPRRMYGPAHAFIYIASAFTPALAAASNPFSCAHLQNKAISAPWRWTKGRCASASLPS